MAGVNVPQKQPGPARAVLPAAAGAVGSYFGGPVGGTAASVATGEAMRGGSSMGPQGVQSDAIGRRLSSYEQAEAADPMKDLAAAQQAVQQLPPDLQKQYAPALAEAQRRAAMGGNV